MNFVRIFGYVFLFLVKLRFPSDQSIAQIIKKRYDENVLKLVRKFERIDFQQRKAALDVSFLEECQRNGFIPNFLNFRMSSKNLKSSQTYRKCQENLLKEEIRLKKSLERQRKNEFSILKSTLKEKLNSIDFMHICSLFLTSNDKSLEQHKETQDKKLSRLTSVRTQSNNPDKVIFNYSSKTLTEDEKNLLAKGLNFSIPPSKLGYSDYLVNFELLFRDVKNLELSAEDMEFVKTKIKDTALTSFRSFDKNNIPSNLSESEFQALRNLSSNLDIVIQKSDKGNSVVLVDKVAYIERVKSLLTDPSKFQTLDIDNDKKLNFIINQEKRLRSVFTSLLEQGSINERTFNKLWPCGSRFGILYGSPKVHKEAVDGVPPYRPILSAIDTPTYQLAKFLVPLLSNITANEYTVKDSFGFAKEILSQDSSLYMASLDVDSLFTNIPLNETIDICLNGVFAECEYVEGLDRDSFKQLLTLAVSESYFIFDGQCYQQIDGVAMGSPLGPTLANAFLCYHEKNWLDECPASFKPLYYRRYVDDIFVLFSSPDHLSLFKAYLNSKHNNITFSSETEQNGKLAFLDVQVSKVNGKFVTDVYRKPTFSGVYSNFNSFIPISYKYGLVLTLIFRCFSICSDMSRFHNELCELKNILRKNGYPLYFLDKCVKRFLDKIYIPRVPIITVPRKEIFICLPYLGKMSLVTRTKLCNIVRKNLPQCDLKVIFKSNCRLSGFFKYKDKVEKALLSKVVYKFTCGCCNASYIGETKRHFKVRACEHMGLSPLTGKVSQSQSKTTAVFEHLAFCNHRPSLDDFSILASAGSKFILELKESLLIMRDNPTLNKNITSAPLYLFKSQFANSSSKSGE